MENADVLIVGAGIVGSATAYFLSIDPDAAGRRIVMIERDPGFREASTGRSAGGLRQQFSTPENIAMSQFTLSLLRTLKERFGPDADAGFREQGYLLLATPQTLPVLAANSSLQRSRGADTALLEPAEIAAAFPWLALEGIAGAGFGRTGEGWFDPPSLAALLRKGAQARGVELVRGDVVGVDVDRGRVAGVRLADGTRVACGTLVNAAGAWAGRLARMAGVELPVEPRKRFVHVIDCRGAPESLHRAPLTIDPSGIWFRPEGRVFLCGLSPRPDREPDIGDLDAVDHEFFGSEIWPRLALRVPAFESVKVVNAWAGYYEVNTLDHNAVIGPHPEIANLMFAAGFSGHGAQQGPAAGQAVAELILHGCFRTIDLARLGYGRIAAGRPVPERNVF